MQLLELRDNRTVNVFNFIFSNFDDWLKLEKSASTNLWLKVKLSVDNIDVLFDEETIIKARLPNYNRNSSLINEYLETIYGKLMWNYLIKEIKNESIDNEKLYIMLKLTMNVQFHQHSSYKSIKKNSSDIEKYFIEFYIIYKQYNFESYFDCYFNELYAEIKN